MCSTGTIGLDLPRWLQVDFSASVQALAERSETEVQSDDIHQLFLETYLLDRPQLSVGNYQLARDDAVDHLNVMIEGLEGSPTLSGKGAGVVGAFTDAVSAIRATRLSWWNIASTPWGPTRMRSHLLCPIGH